MTEPLRFTPLGAVKIADKQSDAVAYIWTKINQAGQQVPCALMYVGKQSKPVWRFQFPSEQRRERMVLQGFSDRRAILQRKAAAKAERPKGNAYKAGDLFRRVWGYDQTNVDYWEVIESKGRYVTVRQLAAKSIENGSTMTGICTPQPGKFDERAKPKRCLVQGERIKINHYAYASYLAPKIVGGVPVYPVDRFSTYA